MKPKINNEFYDHLGPMWYESNDHPIAILRVEQNIKNAWVLNEISNNAPNSEKVLDIGCGGGFLTNFLARNNFNCTGVDISESSLEVAGKNDTTNTVTYVSADATRLPFEDTSFDVVCAMDFLEHVEDPHSVIRESSRLLKQGGLFFFHTFNRNPLSKLIVIKFMEWFMPNTPENMHVYHLFIKPSELKEMNTLVRMETVKIVGLRPEFNWAFFKSILKRELQEGFKFKITKGLALGYMGLAIKK